MQCLDLSNQRDYSIHVIIKTILAFTVNLKILAARLLEMISRFKDQSIEGHFSCMCFDHQ